MTHVRNTDGIRAATQKRREDAYRDVKKALAAMVRDGSTITAAAVARRAGRSARYVQTHNEFGPKIRELSGVARPKRPPVQDASYASGTLAALRVHIRSLETAHRKQLAELRAELQQAHRRIEQLTAKLIAAGEQAIDDDVRPQK